MINKLKKTYKFIKKTIVYNFFNIYNFRIKKNKLKFFKNKNKKNNLF
jgi:hypothetical protein